MLDWLRNLMKFVSHINGIRMSQKSWLALTLSLSAALVASILLLPPWSPLSLTSQEVSSSNSQSERLGAQSTNPGPAFAIRGPAVAPTIATLLEPQVGRATTSTTEPKVTLAPTALPEPAVNPATTPTSNSLQSSGENPENSPAAAPISPGQSVEALILATEDPDWSVRWDAVNALGELKDQRAVPALVKRALYDENPHPQWRSLWALTAVDREGTETIPLFLSALKDPDPVVVHNAALGLAFFNQPEARPALLKGLKDPETFRRWESVFSLRNVGNAEVVQALIPLLSAATESDVGIRGEAALALGAIGGEDAVQALLVTLRSDESPQVRWRAAMALSRHSGSAMAGELERALSEEKDPEVIGAIEETIAKLREP